MFVSKIYTIFFFKIGEMVKEIKTETDRLILLILKMKIGTNYSYVLATFLKYHIFLSILKFIIKISN